MVNNYKKHGLFISAIIILLLFLVGFILTQEQIVKSGEVTILRTLPIDPRDFLRGEHVILRYEIQSDDKIRNIMANQQMNEGSALYLILKEDNQGIATVASVQTEKPRADERLWIMGKVRNRQVEFPDISQYFVPEGAGLSIERMGTEISVEVYLYAGEARIIRLLDKNLVPVDPGVFLEEK